MSKGKGSGLALSGGANLAELIELREFGQALSDDERLRGCGRTIRRGNVGAADEVLDTIISCGRAWLCPVCGYRDACAKSRNLADTLSRWASQGGSIGLLTLTQQHTADDGLGALWGRLESGWAALVRGSGWRTDREAFGLRGYVRITEVVHHLDHGWNVHLHVPLLFDRALDSGQLCELEDHLTARFVRGVKAAGGWAWRNGQKLSLVQPGSERRTAWYCAKGSTSSAHGSSRTPMMILSDLKKTGDGLKLWSEFSGAVSTVKRRRYSPSHNLGAGRPDCSSTQAGR